MSHSYTFAATQEGALALQEVYDDREALRAEVDRLKRDRDFYADTAARLGGEVETAERQREEDARALLSAGREITRLKSRAEAAEAESVAVWTEATKSTRIVRRPIETLPEEREGLVMLWRRANPGHLLAGTVTPEGDAGCAVWWSPLPPLAEEDAPTAPTLAPETVEVLRAASVHHEDVMWVRVDAANEAWVAAGCPDLPLSDEEE